VCQLRPSVNSLGLRSNLPLNSRVNKLWRLKQGDAWCKMAEADFQSFATLRAQILAESHRLFRPVAFRFHTYSRMIHYVHKWTAVSGIVRSVCLRNATHQVVLLSNWQRMPQTGQTFKDLWHSAFKRTSNNPPYTFEHGMWNQSEIQPPPFYIGSPPVWSVISFWCATCRV
jgi:hypothetical protein